METSMFLIMSYASFVLAELASLTGKIVIVYVYDYVSNYVCSELKCTEC